MSRVALVTGGTRGIGAAICKALQEAGYKVAASYAGNDEAAAKFKAETGVPVYKWDVGDYDACAAGIANAFIADPRAIPDESCVAALRPQWAMPDDPLPAAEALTPEDAADAGNAAG